MSAHVFCTHVAHERGEPVEGTGGLSPKYLLFAWPRGKWRVPRSESLGLPPVIAAAMREVEATQWVILVDAPGDVPTLIAYPEQIAVSGSDGEVAAAMRAWGRGEPVAGVPMDRRVVLACVDSRTDACCAKFGLPAYKALAAEADPARTLVLQSCHLGGCRFASSVMLAGTRERYGRMAPGDAPGFIAAIEAGEVYLPRFKGNPDLDEPGQVAELAARRWAAKHDRHPNRIEVAAGADHGGHRRYEAEVGGTRLSITLEARDFLMHGQCEGVHEPPSLQRRWLVRKVVAG
jgi:hypothetical protein